MKSEPVVYLKLGGSLITDKREEEAPRLAVIRRLAEEIGRARQNNPSLQLVLGHGSGSFGHIHAHRFGTRSGVKTAEEWRGFVHTADAAVRLTRIVCGALLEAGLPVWSIQPSVSLRCQDGQITAGPEETVQMALERGLIPLVHGDVAFDSVRGGTIASTEEIFEWLLGTIPGWRMILAGEVDGVFTQNPDLDPTALLLRTITPAIFSSMIATMGPSRGTDVTGGMETKVEQALRMVRNNRNLEVVICSGLRPGLVENALSKGDAPGTTIRGE